MSCCFNCVIFFCVSVVGNIEGVWLGLVYMLLFLLVFNINDRLFVSWWLLGVLKLIE